MLKNYCKTAWRNLRRNSQSSVINIAGLALGISVFILIIEYVASEWNANRFNKHYSRLYRANITAKDGNTEYYLPPGLGPAIKQNISGVANSVRVADGIASGVISISGAANKIFREDNMLYVDGNFLAAFTYPLVAGAASLREPGTLALSYTMSQKLFAGSDAVGKTVTVSNQFGNTLYKVAAVYKDMPRQSDIQAQVLLSLHTLETAAARDGNDWADPATLESGFVNIYIQLQETADAGTVTNNINKLLSSIHPASAGDKIYLQPFSELHLAPTFDYPFQTFGSLLLVSVFSGVAILILLIAWVNYINLSTAQALSRAKDVGVRKVLGATRLQLVAQYLAETFMITLVSVAIAILFVQLLQPFFNSFTGKNLSLAVLNSSLLWLAGILMIVTGSLLSGSYVAYTITSYKPISSLRGNPETATRWFSLRRGMVVFQFTISIIFIISTIILYSQLQFMRTKNLGMNLNQLLVIKGPTVSSDGQAQRNASFKNDLAQLPFVKKYCASNNVPGIGYNFSTEKITRTAPQKGDDKKSYSMFISDDHFFDTYGIKFTYGKSFSRDDAEASWNNVKKVIINEKAAAALGFEKGRDITGQKLLWGSKPYEIIGVIKDYHHLSPKDAIKPTIYLGSVSFGYFTIQANTGNLPAKLSMLKKKYTAAFPGNPFEYFFADEQYDKQYKTDQQLGNVFIASACIAILIACLGLFGLTTYTAKQRIKEIGIRKVLGASITDIVALLSKDFLWLVAIAFIIASPVAWWGMHKWLADFAYPVSISWWVFALAGLAAACIALSTISFQAIKAAVANPVKSLRTE